MNTLKYWLIGIVMVAWLMLLRFIDPVASSHYPTCPFHALTGLDCPGCGSSRCAHDMVHLDFASAFWHNPLAFIAIPGVLIYVVGGIAGWWRKDRFNVVPQSIRSRLSSILLVLIVVFSVLRNL